MTEVGHEIQKLRAVKFEITRIMAVAWYLNMAAIVVAAFFIRVPGPLLGLPAVTLCFLAGKEIADWLEL